MWIFMYLDSNTFHLYLGALKKINKQNEKNPSQTIM